MKKLLFLIIAAGSIACKKDVSRPLACGFVFDKFYSNPPGDTSQANRSYFLRLVSDTVIPVPPAPPNTNWVVQVPRSIYDTMLVAGQPYPPQYCY